MLIQVHYILYQKLKFDHFHYCSFFFLINIANLTLIRAIDIKPFNHYHNHYNITIKITKIFKNMILYVPKTKPKAVTPSSTQTLKD